MSRSENIHQTSETSDDLPFYKTGAQRIKNFALALLMIFISCVGLKLNMPIMGSIGLVCGIGFFLMELLQSGPIISLRSDHLELKQGFVTKTYAYHDALELVREDEKKTHLLMNQQGEQQKVQLPLASLTPEDRVTLIKDLRARIRRA